MIPTKQHGKRFPGQVAERKERFCAKEEKKRRGTKKKGGGVVAASALACTGAGEGRTRLPSMQGEVGLGEVKNIDEQ